MKTLVLAGKNVKFVFPAWQAHTRNVFDFLEVTRQEMIAVPLICCDWFLASSCFVLHKRKAFITL